MLRFQTPSVLQFREMKQLLIFIHAALLPFISGEPSCPSFDNIRLHREVSKKGFHRDLKTVLHISQSQQGSGSEFIIKETFPRDFYIDQYQLADAEAFGGPQTIVPDNVEVERPAALSQDFSFFTYMRPDEGRQDHDTLSVTLPIHLRYQRPEADGGYHTSSLPNPVLAVKCDASGLPPEAKDTDQYLSMPCNASMRDLPCLWKVITYQKWTAPLELSVPVGRGTDLTLVISGTSSAVIICAFMLLYGMFTNHEREE